ncbi:hypothetical protein HK097_001460, partial [Rhizophlyctis rosea]
MFSFFNSKPSLTISLDPITTRVDNDPETEQLTSITDSSFPRRSSSLPPPVPAVPLPVSIAKADGVEPAAESYPESSHIVVEEEPVHVSLSRRGRSGSRVVRNRANSRLGEPVVISDLAEVEEGVSAITDEKVDEVEEETDREFDGENSISDSVRYGETDAEEVFGMDDDDITLAEGMEGQPIPSLSRLEGNSVEVEKRDSAVEDIGVVTKPQEDGNGAIAAEVDKDVETGLVVGETGTDNLAEEAKGFKVAASQDAIVEAGSSKVSWVNNPLFPQDTEDAQKAADEIPYDVDLMPQTATTDTPDPEELIPSPPLDDLNSPDSLAPPKYATARTPTPEPLPPLPPPAAFLTPPTPASPPPVTPAPFSPTIPKQHHVLTGTLTVHLPRKLTRMTHITILFNGVLTIDLPALRHSPHPPTQPSPKQPPTYTRTLINEELTLWKSEKGSIGSTLESG